MPLQKLSDHDKKLIDEIRKDSKNLHDEKDKMLPVYEEITKYLLPRRSGWGFEHESDRDFGRYIFDGESIAAKNRLSDGLFGQLVSPAIDWLEIIPKDRRWRENRRVMAYMKELTQAVLDTFSASNFYDAVSEAIDDCVCLGTTVVNIEEAKKLGRPVYEALHLRECFISENRFGEVDLMHREFDMTYRQLLEEFSEDKLDPQIVKDAKLNMEKRVRIVHAIYPREYKGDADNMVKLDIEKPFASVYLFCGESKSSSSGLSMMAPQAVLRESGFDFKHFEAWRFRRAAGMTYGTSPAMDALYDIKMINVSSKAMADTEQMNARPPIYTDLGMKGRLKIAPGGITYGIGGQKPEPIFQGTNYQISMEGIERRARVIREHFKTEFFMAISQLQHSSRDRTATEIMEIKAESAAVLGSIVGRVQSEFLHPLVENTIRMEAKAGRLPPPPEGIEKDIALNLSFIGPLAQAQRKYLVKQGLENGIAAVGNMAGLFQDPTVLMNVDRNYAARKLMVVSGYPQEGLLDQDKVEKAQMAQAQQQAQMMQAQQELEAQKNLPAMGKAPEKGSPLDSIMGGKQ